MNISTWPDVFLLAIRMPHVNGLEATRALAGPDVADPSVVVVITTFGHDEYVPRLRRPAPPAVMGLRPTRSPARAED